MKVNKSLVEVWATLFSEQKECHPSLILSCAPPTPPPNINNPEMRISLKNH